MGRQEANDFFFLRVIKIIAATKLRLPHFSWQKLKLGKFGLNHHL